MWCSDPIRACEHDTYRDIMVMWKLSSHKHNYLLLHDHDSSCVTTISLLPCDHNISVSIVFTCSDWIRMSHVITIPRTCMIYLLWHWTKSLTAPSVLPRSGNSLLHWNRHKIPLPIVSRNIQKIEDEKYALCLSLWNLEKFEKFKFNKYQVLYIWSGAEIWACFNAQIQFLCR